jgi:hypothetical protein
MFGTIFAQAKIAPHGRPRVVPNIRVKAMTYFKSSFDRLSIATQIFGTLVAGSVLIAGMEPANAHGSGGGGGSHSMGSTGSSHSSSSMSGQKRPALINTIHPIISKGDSSTRLSRRELRKEYKRELRKEIAALKRAERCKLSGKCGSGGPKPIGPQPVGIGKLPPTPGQGTGGTTVGILGGGNGATGTTGGGATTGGGTKPPTTTTGGSTGPVLSDPGYGKPAGGTQTSGGTGGGGGGGGPAGGPPSGGTTIKSF